MYNVEIISVNDTARALEIECDGARAEMGMARFIVADTRKLFRRGKVAQKAIDQAERNYAIASKRYADLTEKLFALA